MKQNWEEDLRLLTLLFSFFDMKILFVYYLTISIKEKQRTR